MKILILGDSHGRTRLMADVVKKHKANVACVLFLGDNAADVYDFAADFDRPIHAVAGNCDFDDEFPREITLDVGGKRIWMSHGDAYSVKYDYDTIEAAAIARGADICLFGHTHDPIVLEKNGILFVNPGSISEPRGRRGKSYAVLEILGDKCLAKIIEI